jgi:aryl-alcohol dehydrogenase-like predicted oxidoreductase
VLAALDEVAGAHHTTVAAVALAWLLAQPTVVAPIASARTAAQLADILPFVELRLSKEELRKLSAASEA